ncbi:hypothetical protein [Bremerella sp. P1]|uniref:hypothetical protein n=1 Tax=Bremerella sp. P1 TaxID=3026424 RepID=UPI00236857A2|nr:hypothetical protein [Bremerella sp. P1]WDI44784.1 hypothetical protein PSR63_12640 [Bremerella sp. P1]
MNEAETMKNYAGLLSKKASTAEDSSDALKFSQAACNIANASNAMVCAILAAKEADLERV